jgi:PilZ domain
MESFNDKRIFPRVAISLNIQVQESENRLAAEMVDLTVQGISFRLAGPLPVGSLISIEISESEDLRSNALKAEVLRCDSPANVNPPQYYQYYVAAKFVEVNDEYLMDSLALVHGKKSKT